MGYVKNMLSRQGLDKKCQRTKRRLAISGKFNTSNIIKNINKRITLGWKCTKCSHINYITLSCF